MTPQRSLGSSLALALLAAACTSKSAITPTPTPTDTTYSMQVASGDLYVGPPQDLEIGISHSDGQGIQLVTFGMVQVNVAYLGADGSGAPILKADATATYVAAPGTTPDGPDPTLSDPSSARGVYIAPQIAFDAAGTWEATATVEINGAEKKTLTAAFTVHATPVLPAPGQKAIPVDNPIIGAKGEPASAIDSRAQAGAKIPDPELHQITIREAMAEHRPILAVFGTPAYCESQFCGPMTDAVEALAKQYPDRAVYIHVEIYRKYASSGAVINKSAADWLYRNNDLTEPWLYLIGADGRILDRWGPLFDQKVVADALAKLPPMKH